MANPLDDEIRELLQAGEKIAAIKRYREETGVGLAEAKAAVEFLESRGSLSDGLSDARVQPDDAEITDQIVTLLGRGEKIEAIKLYRERFGVGLRSAKEAVERIGEQNGIPASSGSGCLGVVLLGITLALMNKGLLVDLRPGFHCIAAAFALVTGACEAMAADKGDHLSRLQGTWKSIATEFRGVRSVPKLEKTWTFEGKTLSTQLGKLPPIVFEIEVNAEADPKELNLHQRGIPKGEPERLCYRFVGDTLEIVQGQKLNQRPTSFDTKDEGSGLAISVFQKTSSNGAIPPEATPHSKNAEAEAVLLKFFAAILKRESLESIEPYVAGGKAKALLAVLPISNPTREAILDEIKFTSVRDILPGERIYYANGTEKLVTATDQTDSKALVMLVQGKREVGFFWVYQERKTWKVDVTNMIDLLRQPGRPLFRGIRAGMDLVLAEKLLKDYTSSGAFKSYKWIRETKTELVVELIEDEVPTRLEFNIADGKLTNVITTTSFKDK